MLFQAKSLITMNLFTNSNLRLPGISGFLKRDPMFHQREDSGEAGRTALIKDIFRTLKNEKVRAGDQFPTPGQISDLTGASLVDSLDAVTALLKSGAIRQSASGRLSVSLHSRG